MIQVPFIFQRISLPERKPKVISGELCYFCDKKIRYEKGYYQFHRKYDSDSDDYKHICHREGCKTKFMVHMRQYDYRNIKFHSGYSDGAGLYF